MQSIVRYTFPVPRLVHGPAGGQSRVSPGFALAGAAKVPVPVAARVGPDGPAARCVANAPGTMCVDQREARGGVPGSAASHPVALTVAQCQWRDRPSVNGPAARRRSVCPRPIGVDTREGAGVVPVLVAAGGIGTVAAVATGPA